MCSTQRLWASDMNLTGLPMEEDGQKLNLMDSNSGCYFKFKSHKKRWSRIISSDKLAGWDSELKQVMGFKASNVPVIKGLYNLKYYLFLYIIMWLCERNLLAQKEQRKCKVNKLKVSKKCKNEKSCRGCEHQTTNKTEM